MANVYRSRLDIKSIQPSFKPTFVQYDHAKLEIELIDGGKPYDLSNATRVEFTHVRSDNLVIIQPGEIVNSNGNYLVTYDYQGNEMDLLGTVLTSFAVFNENERKVSSPIFEVAIVKDLRNDVFSPAEPTAGFLQSLIDDVENIKQSGGIVGPQGIPGERGKDGYTPVKGVDYFDGLNGKDGRDGKDGYTPIKGIDYFDGANGKDGVNGKDGKDGYTPIKGVDYFDGTNGKDGLNGKDGKSFVFDDFTPEQLASLKGEPGRAGTDANVTSANITSALGYTPLKNSDVTWANVINKPTTFEPSTHTHSYNDLTNKPTIPTLNNTVTSTSTTQAATANAVKQAYDRAEQAFTQANNGKNLIASAVVGKGGTASSGDTFSQLAAAITNIPTGGKKWGSGVFTNTSTLNVSGLEFEPSFLIVRGKYMSSDTYILSTYINTLLGTNTTNIINSYSFTASASSVAVKISEIIINSDGFELGISNIENYEGIWFAFE